MNSLFGVRALILAAGYGTRLLPLTERWPKCLMPIAGRPLLEYWLEISRNMGADRVLINTHAHAEIVEEFILKNKFADGVLTSYEPTLLGTAGTLRKNKYFFNGFTIMMTHADNWCHCDFGDFLNAHLYRRPASCLMTMMTFKTDFPETCGIVETDQKGIVIGFHEKVSNPPGNQANAAVYLLEPEILEWVDVNRAVSDFSTEVIPKFLGRIATWRNENIHRDIGTLPALRAAQRDKIISYPSANNNEWLNGSRFMADFNEIRDLL